MAADLGLQFALSQPFRDMPYDRAADGGGFLHAGTRSFRDRFFSTWMDSTG